MHNINTAVANYIKIWKAKKLGVPNTILFLGIFYDWVLACNIAEISDICTFLFLSSHVSQS